MKYIFLVTLVVCISCGPSAKFNKDEALFNSSAVVRSFKSVADMNDSYFVIKQNNFFEFYRQLFDSVKNTSYPGKYIMKGDTMILQFYHKKGAILLGSKALVNDKKNEIVFFR